MQDPAVFYIQGRRKKGYVQRKVCLYQKGLKKTDFKCFSQQPALLRLKQHISEKSRTTQSQVITEEEAFDQVKFHT